MSLLRNCRSIVGVTSKAVFAQRLLNKVSSGLSVVRSFSSATEPPAVAKDDDELADGEQLLYKASQLRPIIIMLGVSGVNGMYFSSQLVNYAMYKDVVVEGISLAGDPLWGGVGAIATLGILYFTRIFAHNSVYQAYETEDHQRIGFQMHTLFGKPGRKFEVPIGNVRFIQRVNQVTRTEEELEAVKGGFMSKVFQSSYIPMSVNGFDGNVIIDVDGDFKDKARLVELINEPEKVLKENAKRAQLHSDATVAEEAPPTHFRTHKANKSKKIV